MARPSSHAQGRSGEVLAIAGCGNLTLRGLSALRIWGIGMARTQLQGIIATLEATYGLPAPPLDDPWLLILWENVAYLANDQRRRQAFATLQRRVGTDPEQIWSASHEALFVGEGIIPEHSVGKLRRCAEIALAEFPDGLEPAVKLPLPQAKKALGKFPGIGEPGAEKILLFTRSHPVFALESNGLRVLRRLGYGEEHKNYSTMYHSVQNAVKGEALNDYDWLIAAHQLLRHHGQQLCKTSQPHCAECPLTEVCSYYESTRRISPAE